MATVSALDEDAFDPGGHVVVALDDSIDGALGNNTYGHYAEHAAYIRRVLAEVG